MVMTREKLDIQRQANHKYQCPVRQRTDLACKLSYLCTTGRLNRGTSLRCFNKKGIRMKIKQTCLAVLVLSATVAQAQWYGEIGATPLSVKANVDGNTIKANPTMLGLVIGYEFHPNLALEGMAATNVDSDVIRFNGTDVPGTSLKVNRAYGVFIKPKIMLTPEWELFGRVGWVENKTTGQVGSYSITDKDHDVAYGLGLNYHFSKTSYGALSYNNFYDKDGVKTRGAMLSVGMKF